MYLAPVAPHLAGADAEVASSGAESQNQYQSSNNFTELRMRIMILSA